MRRLWVSGAALACLVAATAAATSARAEPAEYRLDPAHTFVHFEVRHFGTSTIRGRFGPVSGSVMLDRDARQGSVSLTIDTGTVSTGLRVFDARLREADLLATELHPVAGFVSERFVFDGDRLAEVRGTLTVRGVAEPVVLKATRFACEQRALLQREVCGGDFEAEVSRSSFGAAFIVPFVADRVRLVIQVEGARVE